MSKDKPITLAEVLEIPMDDPAKGEWVNGLLTVAISNIETKGKAIIAKLSDPDNPGTTIRAAFFGRTNVLNMEGKIVTLSGAVKVKEYNGHPELSCSGKFSINVVGDAPGRGGGSGSRGDRPPPGNGGGKSKDTYNAGAIGQRIGNALTNACHLIAETVGSDEDVSTYLRTPKFAQDVWVIASWIMRAGDRLEAGNLARTDDNGNLIDTPPPAKKEAPPPKEEPPPVKKPTPTHDGSAFGGTRTPDMEDVPF